MIFPNKRNPFMSLLWHSLRELCASLHPKWLCFSNTNHFLEHLPLRKYLFVLELNDNFHSKYNLSSIRKTTAKFLSTYMNYIFFQSFKKRFLCPIWWCVLAVPALKSSKLRLGLHELPTEEVGVGMAQPNLHENLMEKKQKTDCNLMGKWWFLGW